MSIVSIIKKIIPYKFKRRIKDNLGVPSLHRSLQNLKRLNFNPSVIIDVGAYEGFWTLDCLEIFPSAKILMIEAQQSKEEALKKVVRKFPLTEYAITVLSSTDGKKVLFSLSETASHVENIATENSINENTHNYLIAKTLDTVVKEMNFPEPHLLKLDVQGHELEVLKAAAEVLKNVEICILEVTLLEIGAGTPLMAEVIQFMDERNFQMYDISQFMRRPFDKALYQLDAIFINKTSLLIADKRW